MKKKLITIIILSVWFIGLAIIAVLGGHHDNVM